MPVDFNNFILTVQMAFVDSICIVIITTFHELSLFFNAEKRIFLIENDATAKDVRLAYTVKNAGKVYTVI